MTTMSGVPGPPGAAAGAVAPFSYDALPGRVIFGAGRARLIEPAVPPDNPVPAGAAELRRLLHDAWSGSSPAGP